MEIRELGITTSLISNISYAPAILVDGSCEVGFECLGMAKVGTFNLEVLPIFFGPDLFGRELQLTSAVSVD